jgi:hypothetical protein
MINLILDKVQVFQAEPALLPIGRTWLMLTDFLDQQTCGSIGSLSRSKLGLL